MGAALAATALLLTALFVTERSVRRFDPYIRAQAIQYLRHRFDCDASIDKLDIRLPSVGFWQLIRKRGDGAMAEVTGEGVTLRHREIALTINMKRFHFAVDLGRVFDPVKRVSSVRLEQVVIQVPPERKHPSGASVAGKPIEAIGSSQVHFEHIELVDSRLVILPGDPSRMPLEFALHRVILDSAGPGKPLQYRANLTIATPPGLVEAHGSFGPWRARSPGDTPLDGAYTFRNANLGVFTAIAGSLTSKGVFYGSLSSITAKGEADVPDFRLRSAGHPMVLHTSFEALVDGTNGNTILRPVRARIGTSAFTTSGAILKHDGNPQHSIDLDVNMPDGEMLELLQLTVPAKPFLSGRLQMRAKIHIPSSAGSVNEKLILDGRFHVAHGQFLDAGIQSKIDSFSRTGQGQPKNPAIGNVFSDMAGGFHLENENIEFSSLSFGVPGSRVDLAGRYNILGDRVDFRGALRLDAKVSEMTTGWKHWLLKVADPFFAKHGAGTFLKIRVQGSSKDPHFGMDW